MLAVRGIEQAAQSRRVQWTKQPRWSRGSGLSFSSAIPGAQKMQGTATRERAAARKNGPVDRF